MERTYRPTKNEKEALRYFSYKNTKKAEPSKRTIGKLFGLGLLGRRFVPSEGKNRNYWTKELFLPDDIRVQLDTDVITIGMNENDALILETAYDMTESGRTAKFHRVAYSKKNEDYAEYELDVVTDVSLTGETGIDMDMVRDSIRWLDSRGFLVKAREFPRNLDESLYSLFEYTLKIFEPFCYDFVDSEEGLHAIPGLPRFLTEGMKEYYEQCKTEGFEGMTDPVRIKQLINGKLNYWETTSAIPYFLRLDDPELRKSVGADLAYLAIKLCNGIICGKGDGCWSGHFREIPSVEAAAESKKNRINYAKGFLNWYEFEKAKFEIKIDLMPEAPYETLKTIMRQSLRDGVRFTQWQKQRAKDLVESERAELPMPREAYEEEPYTT